MVLFTEEHLLANAFSHFDEWLSFSVNLQIPVYSNLTLIERRGCKGDNHLNTSVTFQCHLIC